MGKRFTFEEIEQHAWPGMTDDNSCASVVTAIALTSLGYPHSIKDIDKMSGRAPNEVMDVGKNVNRLVGLLAAGFKVEHIGDIGYKQITEYLDPASGKTYEDFIRDLGHLVKGQHMGTPDGFKRHRALYVAAEARFAPYRRRDRLAMSHSHITTDLLKKKTREGAVLAAVKTANPSLLHQVAIMGPPKAGEVLMANPDPFGTAVEAMSAKAALSYLVTRSGLTVISR